MVDSACIVAAVYRSVCVYFADVTSDDPNQWQVCFTCLTQWLRCVEQIAIADLVRHGTIWISSLTTEVAVAFLCQHGGIPGM